MRYKRIAKWLGLLDPSMPDEALEMIALVKIAQYGSLNNLQIRSELVDNPDRVTPANVYVASFLESGSGKDRALRNFDKGLCGRLVDDFKQRAEEAKVRRFSAIRDEAKDLYPESEAEQRKHVQANSPRALALEISDATLEGFVAFRQAYHHAGWGGLFVKISELAEYITGGNRAHSEFLTMLAEVYNDGDNNVKATKGERSNEPIVGVPSNALMHTSPSRLMDKNAGELVTFLERMAARRCYVCFSERPAGKLTEDVQTNLEMKRAGRAQARAMVEELRGWLWEFYSMTKHEERVVPWNNTNKTYTYTEEADERIERYACECEILAMKIPVTDRSSGLRAELVGRQWRAMKLSGVIAAFEHPTRKTVEVQDVEEAIRLTDRHGRQFVKFYTRRSDSDAVKLLQTLGEEQWVTKTALYGQPFAPGNTSKVSSWLEDNLRIAREILEDRGMLLYEARNGKRGKKYCVLSESFAGSKQDEVEKYIFMVQNNKSTVDKQ